MKTIDLECPVCDSENTVVSRRDVDGAGAGFPGLQLTNVSTLECPDCGETVYYYPTQKQLFSRLAKNIALSEGQLQGEDFARMRKALRYSGKELADTVGVSNVSISRWENEQVQLPKYMSILIRSLALLPQNVRDAVVGTERAPRKSLLSIDLGTTDIRAERLSWGRLVPNDYVIEQNTILLMGNRKAAKSSTAMPSCANDPEFEWGKLKAV